MSSTERDTNYADIDNLDNIIMVANVGAPAISDLSPNSDWKSYGHGTLNSCYGLPYQDHNYGAPPPPTPPPSPGRVPITKKRSVQPTVVRSIKGNKSLSERKNKPPAKRQAGVRLRRRNSAPVSKLAVKSGEEVTEEVSSAEPVVNVVEESEEVTEPATTTTTGVGGGDYSGSITRCICNFTHDDGYMICCDQCQVWQHIDCMGIEREDIPEEYSCEECMPRKVSKARARMIQKQKREEIFKSSSEDENSNSKARPNMSSGHSPTNNESDMPKRPPLKSRNKKTTTPVHNDFMNGRKKSTTDDCIVSQRQQRSSKRLSRGSADTMFLSVDGDAEDSPWTASYEVATMNQYSTDVEESLKSYKTSESKQSTTGNGVLEELSSPKCQLRLLVNGRRGLEVDRTINPHEALIEFKGKVMLQQQYQQENSLTKRPQPFVLFYNKWEEMDLCVDATSFGNAARFVRRSCVPNAEVRHLIENGQLHLVLYAVKDIPAASEVTIPYDYDFKSCEYCVECACVRAQCPVRKAARKLIKSLSNGSGEVHRLDQSNSSPTTPAPSQVPSKNNCADEMKVEIPSPEANDKTSKSNKCDAALKSPNSESQDTKPMSREQRKIEAYMKAFEKMEKREERRREALQRIHEKKDNSSSEEIVDIQPETKTTASTAPTTTVEQKRKPVPKTPVLRRRRNKSGSAVRRRTNSSTTSQPVSEEEENSNSTFAETHASGDGVLAPSTRIPAPAEVGSTCVGTIGSLSTSGFRFPKTKKDLLSNWYHEKGLDKPMMTAMQTPEKHTATSTSVDKPLSIQTSMTPAANDDDNMDFVITNPSPGSTFAHLRRNSICTNQNSHHLGGAQRKLDTSLGSAKKRWLKQAMEEGDANGLSCPAALISPNSRQSSPTNAQTVRASTAPSSTVVSPSPLSPNSAPTGLSTTTTSCDFVTPLKKRRLMRESLSVDDHPMSPELAASNVVPVASPKNITSPHAPAVTMNMDVQAIDMTTIARRPATPTKDPTSTTSVDFSPVKTPSTNPSDQTGALADSNVALPEPPMSHEPPGMQMEQAGDQTGKDTPTVVGEISEAEPIVSADESHIALTDQIPATVAELPPTIPAGTLLHTPAPPTVAVVDERAPLPLPVEAMRDSYRPLAAALPLEPDPSNQYVAFHLPPPPHLIMSPAEPRTLSDMLYMSTAGRSPSTGDSRETVSGAVTSGMNTEMDTRSQCSQSLSAASLMSPNKLTTAVKRSASLMEQGSEADGSADGCSSPSSCKASPDGGFSPVAEGSTSPAQRKKVSLLEYRKRMKVKVTSSGPTNTTATSHSVSTATSLPRLAPANKRILQPITLPSLPLFQPVPILPKPDAAPRPVIKSLNDRLAQEFGVVSSTSDTSPQNDTEDGDRTPPPPPPPPLPCEESGKPLNSSNLTNTYTHPSPKNGTIHPVGTATSINSNSSMSPSQQNTRIEAGSVNSLDNRNSSPSFLIKQGSLGAVMLGHSRSSVVEPSDSIVKEIQETKLRRDYNLPKKYQHTAADIHR